MEQAMGSKDWRTYEEKKTQLTHKDKWEKLKIPDFGEGLMVGSQLALVTHAKDPGPTLKGLF